MIVVPLHRARNKAFGLKHALNIAAQNSSSGERYLQQQLDVRCATMARRDISQEMIEPERRQLENAIRAALSTVAVRRPGGAA